MPGTHRTYYIRYYYTFYRVYAHYIRVVVYTYTSPGANNDRCTGTRAAVYGLKVGPPVAETRRRHGARWVVGRSVGRVPTTAW